MKSRLFFTGLPSLLFLLLFLHTAWENSPTWDETGYLGLGGYLIETGRWDVPAACSHPPLAYYVHGLPSLFYPIDWRDWTPPPSRARDILFLRSADLERGNRLLLDPRYDGELFFFLSRTTSLLFALLLFVLLYSWARQVHGPQGGWLALLLGTSSPTLLAHAPLITTDFPLAATFFLSAYTFRRLLLHPSLRRLGLAGLGLGLALLTKLSALVLLPIFGLLLVWFLFAADPSRKEALASLFPLGRGAPANLALLYLSLCLTAFLVVWAGYGFQIEPYLLTVQSQLWDLSTGHEAYLMGSYSSKGWWYYYPVAFLIKTSLPLLILGAWGTWRLLRDRRPGIRLEQGFLFLPPLLFALPFIWGDKDIGIRYLLPVYPFLFLAASGTWEGLSRTGGRRASTASVLVILLAAWHLAGTLRIHPHHLAYFNELIGGPENGYRYLVDSNLDWGQDLKGLKEYMDERGIERIKLSYFGTVDPALYHLEYEWLPSFVLPRPPKTPVILPTTGTIAVSATNLVGVYMDQYGHGKKLFAWLWDRKPVARIGYSIFVYDIQ